MSDQNPYGAPPPPPPPPPFGPPPAEPQYGYPPAAQPYGAVPPQPGPQGYPDYAGFPPVQPKKSRKALWIVLGCVGGAILAGAGVLAYVIYDTASTTGNRQVVLPETFQGLKQDHSNPIAEKMQNSLQDSFGKGANAWTPTAVSALYTGDAGGPDADKAMIVFGGYGNVIAPGNQLDEFFSGFEKGISSAGSSLGDRRDFDAGPLGGQLRCAVMKAETESDSLCAWADGSSVVGVLTGKVDSTDAPDLAAAAAAARELRQAAEIPK